ncbi:MAG: hypothetical protein WBA57_08920 [Elainellaceae cyanobacterium]
MNPTNYLRKILEGQIFDNDDQELKDLRQRRNDIANKLRSRFSSSSPSICWAGSKAKGTMIRESYDGDMTCYFLHDEEKAGKTLNEIYEAVEQILLEDYYVERKASALRVRDKNDRSNDLHIDVVPGRYTDETKGDVFLHRTTGDKQRLKTNLQTHIDYIKDSDVIDAIRLIKLWKVLNGLSEVKTFVLELLVVKILEDRKSSDLSIQLTHVWNSFRDDLDNMSIKDPANSNNDLKPGLDSCRDKLSVVAKNTLWQIDNNGWDVIFKDVSGGIESNRDLEQSTALQVAVANVITPTKPWLQGM